MVSKLKVLQFLKPSKCFDAELVTQDIGPVWDRRNNQTINWGSRNKPKNWISNMPLIKKIMFGLVLSHLFISCNFKRLMPVILESTATPTRLKTIKIPKAIPINNSNCIPIGLDLRYVCISPCFPGVKFAPRL